MYDVLLSRYSDMQFILQLDIDTVIALIKKAYQQREEERAWQLYCSVYPHFDKKNYKAFSDFYKGHIEPVSVKSREEIMARTAEILKKAGEKNGNL